MCGNIYLVLVITVAKLVFKQLFPDQRVLEFETWVGGGLVQVRNAISKPFVTKFNLVRTSSGIFGIVLEVF